MAERKIDCFYSCTIQEVCKIPIEGGKCTSSIWILHT